MSSAVKTDLNALYILSNEKSVQDLFLYLSYVLALIMTASFLYHFNNLPELEPQSNYTNLTTRYQNEYNDAHTESFGKTFVVAALFPLVTVFAILIIWKVLQCLCDRAVCTDANVDSDDSPSNANPRPVIMSSLSSGQFRQQRQHQNPLNTMHDLHSIFIFDLRALPQIPVDAPKEEPPPSYHDEVLSLPSYDEAIKNLHKTT